MASHYSDLFHERTASGSHSEDYADASTAAQLDPERPLGWSIRLWQRSDASPIRHQPAQLSPAVLGDSILQRRRCCLSTGLRTVDRERRTYAGLLCQLYPVLHLAHRVSDRTELCDSDRDSLL